MRLLSRGIAGLVTLLGLSAAAIWWIVSPPPPLAMPEPGVVLDGVTLVEPGAGQRPAMRVVVEADRIESIEPAGPGSEGEFAGAFVCST
jgi:hypothetical protein